MTKNRFVEIKRTTRYTAQDNAAKRRDAEYAARASALLQAEQNRLIRLWGMTPED
jgi:hypothetical protein